MYNYVSFIPQLKLSVNLQSYTTTHSKANIATMLGTVNVLLSDLWKLRNYAISCTIIEYETQKPGLLRIEVYITHIMSKRDHRCLASQMPHTNDSVRLTRFEWNTVWARIKYTVSAGNKLDKETNILIIIDRDFDLVLLKHQGKSILKKQCTYLWLCSLVPHESRSVLLVFKIRQVRNLNGWWLGPCPGCSLLFTSLLQSALLFHIIISIVLLSH
jgi:hypothetical protein